MAISIIGATLLLVGEHFVGFLDLFELFLGFLVARIAVRVIFHCELAISLFQLIL